MKPHRFTLPISLLTLGVAAVASANVAEPAKRMESLNTARALLAPRPAAAVVAASNPFYSVAFADAMAGRSGATAANTDNPSAKANPVATRPVGPRPSRELLESIAAGLKPSGIFKIGGKQTLVFGQKRVQAGDTMAVMIGETKHTLTIVDISPPHFTISLNNEELTRPIK